MLHTTKTQQVNPKIRFPEFSDDWNVCVLGNFLIKHDEISSSNDQFPVLTSSRKGIYFQRDYYANGEVASSDTTGYNVVPRGYFTYRHMSDDLVFRFNINNLCDKGIVSTLYPVFTTTRDLDDDFLRIILNNGNEFKKFAVMQKQGGSRTYMYYKKLAKLRVTIPHLNEQIKISKFFVNLDQYLENLYKKRDSLQRYRSIVTTKLFSQVVRFKKYDGKNYKLWERRKLKDLFYERNEKNKLNTNLLLSVSVNNGVTLQSSTNKTDSSNINKNNYKIVKSGDIAYNTMRMWQGASGVSKFDGIVSPAYTVVYPKNGNSNFYGYLFKQKSMIFQFYRYSQGLTSDTWNLKFQHFSEISVTVPSEVEEQERISSFIALMDSDLENIQNYILHIEQWKKGLLQKMII